MGSCLSRPSARSELNPQPNPINVSLRSVQSVPQSAAVHSSSTAAPHAPLVQPLSMVQLMMVHLNTVQDKWFLIGIALGISVTIFHTIEQSYPQGGVDRWLVEMIQYWLDSDPAACWERLVRALEQLDLLALAAAIKQKYLWKQSPSEYSAEGGATEACCNRAVCLSVCNKHFSSLTEN